MPLSAWWRFAPSPPLTTPAHNLLGTVCPGEINISILHFWKEPWEIRWHVIATLHPISLLQLTLWFHWLCTLNALTCRNNTGQFSLKASLETKCLASAAYLCLKDKSFQTVEILFSFLFGQVSVCQILQPENIRLVLANRRNNITRAGEELKYWLTSF